MKRKGLIVWGAALGWSLLGAQAFAAAAPEGWDLRLGGGYGLSLNETYYGNANRPLPLSEGSCGQAEVLRHLGAELSLGLGLFPVGMQRRYDYLYLDGGQQQTGEVRESALFLPLMLSLYLERPLGPGLSLLLGLGAGAVPATSVWVSDTGSWSNGENRQLDAGFAWRSQLGLRWNLHPRLGLLASLQQLCFDQHWFAPASLGGFWLAETKSFSQLAPGLALELRL